MPLFRVLDRIASYQWDLETLPRLHIELAAAMKDEEQATRLVPKRLLGVWAHPDDEAYLSAGLMARVVDHGGSVTVVTANVAARTEPTTRAASARRCSLHSDGASSRPASPSWA